MVAKGKGLLNVGILVRVRCLSYSCLFFFYLNFPSTLFMIFIFSLDFLFHIKKSYVANGNKSFEGDEFFSFGVFHGVPAFFY